MELSEHQKSHAEAKDPTDASTYQTICTTCYNIDVACVPPKRFSDPGGRRAKHGTRRIITNLESIRVSTSNGCPACAVLHEGISIHCARVAHESQSTRMTSAGPRMLYIEFRPGHGVDVWVFYQTEDGGTATIIIEFYTRLGDVPAWRSLGYARDVPATLNMGACIRPLKEWLTNCSKNHPACVMSSPARLPARLLDVSSFENGSIKLVASSSLSRVNYIALSHCWGQTQSIKTSKSNLKSHFKGIAWDDLPKTFQDAVSITSKLDIRYIWIDSLCIVQDDLEDWREEASKMATIYSSSYLTLSVLHSPDNNGGCFSDRYTSDFGNLEAQVPTTSFPISHSRGDSTFTIMTRIKPRNAHAHFSGGRRDDSPLGLRAWALQERLLSPRTLYFHSQELVWECKTHIACECGNLESYLLRDYAETDLPNSRLKARIQPTENRTSGEAAANWLRIVSVYAALNITRQSDILPALAGLASHFSTFISGKYLAGLWSDDLPRSLLWRKLRASSRHLDESSSDDSMLPSWSWAASMSGDVHDAGITYNVPLEDGFVPDPQYRCEYSTTSTSGVFSYGSYTWGTLRLTGRCILVDYYRAYDRSRVPIDTVSRRGSAVGFVPDVCLSEPGRAQIGDGEVLCCLLVATHASIQVVEQIVQVESSPHSGKMAEVALVLKADSAKEGTFRRIGLIQISKNKTWFTDADVVELTVV